MNRLLLCTLTAFTACGVDSSTTIVDDPGNEAASAELRLPKEDRSDTVDVMSWNVEWFGSVNDGPTDEALQQKNVARVLRATAPDLIGLVEVVSPAAFASVVAALPNHDGLLVTDARVTGGAREYSANEQKVALLYNRRFKVDSARVVVTNASYAFAGRPPMEVKLSFEEGGKPRTLIVLVAHFKAMANLDGYTRRTDAALALKAFMDAEYGNRWVLLVGDLNDDLDSSTYRHSATPFAPFLADPSYRFTTDALTTANVSTTLTFRSTIDHHLAHNGLLERFVEGSAKVVKTTDLIPDAATTTSDHLPVLTRYDLR